MKLQYNWQILIAFFTDEFDTYPESPLRQNSTPGIFVTPEAYALRWVQNWCQAPKLLQNHEIITLLYRSSSSNSISFCLVLSIVMSRILFSLCLAMILSLTCFGKSLNLGSNSMSSDIAFDMGVMTFSCFCWLIECSRTKSSDMLKNLLVIRMGHV